MVVHEKVKKKIVCHFLITKLKDLCCYAFYVMCPVLVTVQLLKYFSLREEAFVGKEKTL